MSENLDKKDLPQKIGIIHSEVKREYFATEDQYITEKDAIKDAEIVADYLEKMGIKTTLYPGDANLTDRLKADKPDMVFNLVDSVKGQEYLSSAIPGLLELLDIPYTGVGILGCSLCYNKFLVKKLLEQNGVPVPNCQLFTSHLDDLNPQLKFPLISKLNEIHGAVEITKNCISEDEKHLRDRLRFLIHTYEQPVVVEEFISGREITAILLEGINRKVYLAEKNFVDNNQKFQFVSFEGQWVEGAAVEFHYQKYQDDLLSEYAKKAFDAAKMDDYAKFDIRMDKNNKYYFIDANPNPAFGPKETDNAISVILNLYNINFTEILRRLIINTTQKDD